MKKNFFLCSITIMAAVQLVFAQTFDVKHLNAHIFTMPLDSGGGPVTPPMDDLSPVLRQQIQVQIDKAIDSLFPKQRNLNLLRLPTVTFSWPIKLAAGVTDSGFYGISNYIDHNLSFPNQLQDYNCGTRTYDVSSGYNHTGTDIFTWPFPWYKMDNNHVEVIAAAPGTIISKSDGNFDRNCAFNNNQWNAIYIQHSDGTIAWYGHLKNGSVTSKAAGQPVVAGEYLGIVGSSGSSTGPHLHFEVKDNLGNVLDPWNGPCNTSSSMWISQQPYYNSRLNKIMTCSVPPVHPACPGQESLNQSSNFCGGNTFYVYAAYRDQQSGQSVAHKIIQPNGVIWNQWTQNFTATYNASWWYYTWILPSTPQAGVWKYQATYLGIIYETTFNVNTNATASVSVSASPAGAVCSGTNVIFTASPNNGGTTPSYQWLLNNGNVGSNSNTYSNTNLANGNQVKCVMTSNRTCVSANPTTSNTLTISVNPSVTAAVSISATPSGAVCPGTNVTFTATPTNGGSTPAYQWKKNNVNVATGPSYSSIALQNKDTIKTLLTSNANCVTGNTATSNSFIMNVTACTVTINLKAFLEGFYILGADSMQAVVDPVNSPGICDSVTFALADSATLQIVASDFKPISTHGLGIFNFTSLTAGHRYYLVLKHRNSIEIWSKYSFLFENSVLNFDFTQ